MTNYDLFARHYDEAMGINSEKVTRILSLINRYAPEARSILELACGTGTILAGLADKYEVTGLDLSGEMLAAAHKKLPQAVLHQADMAQFDLDSTYDVVLCVFDSINHVPHLEEWSNTFKNAARHLNKDGVFHFDINTISRLAYLAQEPPALFSFKDGTSMSMDVIKVADNQYNWQLSFTDTGGDRYQENVIEAAFPIAQVEELLAERFEVLETSALPEGGQADDNADRIFITCRKRAN